MLGAGSTLPIDGKHCMTHTVMASAFAGIEQQYSQIEIDKLITPVEAPFFCFPMQLSEAVGLGSRCRASSQMRQTN